MKTVSKLAILALLLALSCLAAGIFGMVHNQVSFAIGPTYFHDLKFAQFRISPELHGPVGAAIVGWRASWWMGVLVGIIPFTLALLLIRSPAAYLRIGIRAIVIVFALAAGFAGLALIAGTWMTEDLARAMLPGRATGDPVGFARAALMHEASYIGGAIGTLVALVVVVRNRKAGQD